MCADYITVFLIRVSKYCDLLLDKSLYYIVVPVCAGYIAVFLIRVSKYCDLSLNKSLYYIVEPVCAEGVGASCVIIGAES